MDFEKQKPVSDEFRKGWIALYASQQIAGALTELDRILAEDMASGTQFSPDFFRAYPNGCPILNEDK